MDIEYMDNKEIKFTRTEGGILALDYKDKHYDAVLLQRAFPLSKPWIYIAVKAAAAHKDLSEEIGIIEDVTKLGDSNRRLVEEELSQRYYVPKVTKIHSLKDEFGQVYLKIDTDAGTKNIVCNNSTYNFLMLGPNRVLIVDIDGNRFEIPVLSDMDKKTRRLLEVVI